MIIETSRFDYINFDPRLCWVDSTNLLTNLNPMKDKLKPVRLNRDISAQGSAPIYASDG